MKSFIASALVLGILTSTMNTNAASSNTTKNPLLQPWPSQYGGVPPFDKVKVADFKPALEFAIADYKKEIEAIAKNPEASSFKNTLEAFDNAGEKLELVGSIFGTWSNSMSTPEYQAVEQEFAPKLAAIRDEIFQNADLFKRIDAVNNSLEKSKLTSEQQRLVWYQETKFVLNGARLNSEQKKQVADINQKLASLYTQFSQNQLADEEGDFLAVESAADLAGLPQAMIESAAAEGERRKIKGQWIIANTRSSMEPFLTYSTVRALREKAFKIWTSRGDNGNKFDNNKIITEILKLRTERSKILGYESFAHWHLADTMAKDPKNAMELMMKVWKPAVERVKTEVADMQKIVDQEKGNFKIQAWDYRYYAEKVRKAKYDLDFETVKPYLELENIRKAMFWTAEKLYGFHFHQIHDVPFFNEAMTAYKVTNAKGGLIGLWYFDPYARPGKNSGAWMSNYREQFKIAGKNITTLVSNNSNFIAGKKGEAVYISWDDANTMFHEFGHALHGLSSNVTYKSLSGTNTTRDFVELPSQMHEKFLLTSEVLGFLKNKEGKTLPQALIEKIKSANTFNSGFSTVEFLASAIVDMKLHLASSGAASASPTGPAAAGIDPKAFEIETLKELGMPSEIVMRHRIPAFGHIFSSESYAAGYYGYLWAQVLDCDAFEAFTETGDAYNKVVAKKYFDLILSVGNTKDPAENYRKFRGRDPKVDALLRSRGF